MKPYFPPLLCVQLFFALLPFQSHASFKNTELSTIHLTQIHPLGLAPYKFISDRLGNSIIANKDYNGYQRSFDKGLTWTATTTGHHFDPQEFSPQHSADVLAIGIHEQMAQSTLDLSVDTGTSWARLPVQKSNCPIYTVVVSGNLKKLTPAIVKFYPNRSNTYLFVAPTGTGHDGIYYSHNGGQTCRKTLESSRGLELSITDNGKFMSALNRKTGELHYSINGIKWNEYCSDYIDKPFDQIMQITAQPYDANYFGSDYLAATDKNNKVKIYHLSVGKDAHSCSGFESNLSGIHYLDTTQNGHKLFAIDGHNHFMFNTSIEAGTSSQFKQLNEAFDQTSSKPDLSNWTFTSLTWTNPDHTQGIVNFNNYGTSEQIAYKFQIT